MARPSIRDFWLFTRPKTLIAALAPSAMGGILGFLTIEDADLLRGSLIRFSVFLLAAVLLQILCNFVNDYFDFQRASDSPENRIGPRRLLQQGKIRKNDLKKIIIAGYFLFIVQSLIIGYLSSYWILVIALMSMVASFLYSGGRYPLAFIGLGELAAFIFFGPVITFSAYYAVALESRFIVSHVLASSLACGSFAWLLITMNNLRDMEADMKSARRTIPLLLGKTFTLGTVILCVLIILALPLWMAYIYSSVLFLFLALATLLLFLKRFYYVFKAQGHEYNTLLSNLGIIYSVYAVIFCISLFFV